ncbi:exodeoxyribonuclease VII small subunit [Allosaccharopolyspora coralli]|uniref:Exodeoxyribonuclease 7 small subunit n=1 Tax=Allosaccharopolyspora coralli TaxID=2665642 RepID=A0A5Q3QBF5_9PSEU|nr:exodeoxyribonuclease VII small subunit [Allosaccharopolyspora coralli]QGK68805.1 exodeoxyribonuclease VII small subunit [Allosaccharopolyspora coralli]
MSGNGSNPDESGGHHFDPEADHPEVAKLGYEQARDELAEVVSQLEAGGLNLEDSLALWERGEALASVCERHLAGARERVENALAAVEPADEESAADDDTE